MPMSQMRKLYGRPHNQPGVTRQETARLGSHPGPTAPGLTNNPCHHVLPARGVCGGGLPGGSLVSAPEHLGDREGPGGHPRSTPPLGH